MRWKRLLLFVALQVAALSAPAVVIVVDTTNDVIAADGLTSLREAVIWSNTNAGPDTIQLPAGTYTLAIPGTGEDGALTGDLDVNDPVLIEGAGAAATWLDAAGLDRVFFINQDLNVTLTDLSVTGGSAGLGGGIYNESKLHIVRCNIAANAVSGYGGGIFQYSGSLRVEDSAIFNNYAADQGGGGLDVAGGQASLTNCTLSGNYSLVGAGVNRYDGTVILSLCTVVSNTAGLLAGGIYGLAGAGNSIIAGNDAGSGPDVGGGFVSLGHNLFGLGNAVATQAGDIVSSDVGVNELSFGSDATPTHALQVTSPAVNRADDAITTSLLAHDQRGPGFPRVRGLRADIGAFELSVPDDDHDGMPDEWETAFGLNPTNAADAGLDADLDSFANAAEYVSDTVPTNSASHHRISALANTGAVWWVQVPSSTACVYRLFGETTLADGVWTSSWSTSAGQPGFTTLAVTNPAGSLMRVAVERPLP